MLLIVGLVAVFFSEVSINLSLRHPTSWYIGRFVCVSQGRAPRPSRVAGSAGVVVTPLDKPTDRTNTELDPQYQQAACAMSATRPNNAAKRWLAESVTHQIAVVIQATSPQMLLIDALMSHDARCNYCCLIAQSPIALPVPRFTRSIGLV